MNDMSRQPRKWTFAEDQTLREEVEAQLVHGEVKDWCRIAAKLPGRTNKDCRKRWHNSVTGGLKKGQWSKSEDYLLSQGVEQYGQKWTLVASCVGSRSADQCAKRWQQSLDPLLDRSEWREHEDRELIEATQQLGRHWKDIQREYFPERSKNCIKNRYTVLVRRYQNLGLTLPSAPGSESDPTTPNPPPYDPEQSEYFPIYDPPSPQAPYQQWPYPKGNLGFDYTQATTTPHAYSQPHVPAASMAHDGNWGWPATSAAYAPPAQGLASAQYPGYGPYPVAHQPISYDPYSQTGSRPRASYQQASSSRVPAGQQQYYSSSSSGSYLSPRQQYNSMYPPY